MRNFFNVNDYHPFEEAIFQCALAKCIGLTRNCYLCDHYDHQVITVPDCIKSCWCYGSQDKTEVIKHFCLKIFDAIEIKEEQNKDIFILNLGFQETTLGENLFAEYLVPFQAVYLEPHDYFEPLNITEFYRSFQLGSRAINMTSRLT